MQDLTPAVNNAPILPSAALTAGPLPVVAVSSQSTAEMGAATDPMVLELKALRQQALSTQAAIQQLQLEEAGDSYGRLGSSLPSTLSAAAVLPTIGVLIVMGLLGWMIVRRAPARPIGAAGFPGRSDPRRDAARPNGPDHGSSVTYRPAPSKWLWKSLDHSPRVVYREQKPAEVESQRAWLGEPIPASIPRASVGAEAAPLSQWLPPDSEWSSSQFAALQKAKAPSVANPVAPSDETSVPPEAMDPDELPDNSIEPADFASSGNSLMFGDEAAAEAVGHVRKSLANKRAARANAWGMEGGQNDSEPAPDSAPELAAPTEAPGKGADDIGAGFALTATASQDAKQTAPAPVMVSVTPPEATRTAALAVQPDAGDLADFQSTATTLAPDELPSAIPEPPAPEPLYGGDVKLALAQEFAALGLHSAARELANEVLAGAPTAAPTQAQELLHQIEQKEQAQAIEHKRLGVPDKDSPASASKNSGPPTGPGNLQE